MNPNDTVKIKPTESGWREIVAHVDAFNAHMQQSHPNARYRMSVPSADVDGYITGQFWSLMQFFDWTKGAGAYCPFEDMQTVAR